MIDISKETLENSDIEVVIDGLNTLWLNEKNNYRRTISS